MYRRTILNSTMILALVAFISLMTSCDNGGVVTPNANSIDDDYYTTTYFVELPNLNNELGTVASFETEISLPSAIPFCFTEDAKGSNYSSESMGDDHGGKNGKGHGKGHGSDDGKGIGNDKSKKMPHNPIGRILNSLGLDSIQKESIKAIIVAHRDCEVTAYTALKAARTPIINAANASRKAILDSLKQGLLTRQQAGDALKVLNESVKSQMDTDPAVLAALTQLKACWDSLLAEIRAILTPEQQIKWDAFVSSLPVKKTL